MTLFAQLNTPLVMIAAITPEQIGTWVIALGGWLMATVQIIIFRRERSQQRDDQLLQTTLSYFDGGTQRRSIGIALIEGVWRSRAEYAGIFAPVLVNQAVYLLRDSDEATSAHEERNLIRILGLLEQMLPLVTDRSDVSGDLLDSVGVAYGDACSDSASRSSLLGAQTLKMWFIKFGGSEDELLQYHS